MDDGEWLTERDYPDISGILSAKVRRRRALAVLPWEEKAAIVEQMRVLPPTGAWKEEERGHAFDNSARPGGDTA